MTKTEFVEELKKRGYAAENDSGCVMVTTPNMRDLQAIQSIALEVGYGLSFGWRKAAQNAQD